MISPEKVIIALDYSSAAEAEELLKELHGYPVWMKIGMELFYAEGPSLIHVVRERGFKVFLDLKLHDIPNTVEKALGALCRLPIDMINVHAAGGSEMMKRAAGIVKNSANSPTLIAVTQLTSTSTVQMNLEQRISGTIQDSVLSYSGLAKLSGCDGVVCSPLEVPFVKEAYGKDFLTITPGIRPAAHHLEDQKRVTTPIEAINLGTDFMVIGRPITGAKTPGTALDALLQGLL